MDNASISELWIGGAKLPLVGQILSADNVQFNFRGNVPRRLTVWSLEEELADPRVDPQDVHPPDVPLHLLHKALDAEVAGDIVVLFGVAQDHGDVAIGAERHPDERFHVLFPPFLNGTAQNYGDLRGFDRYSTEVISRLIGGGQPSPNAARLSRAWARVQMRMADFVVANAPDRAAIIWNVHDFGAPLVPGLIVEKAAKSGKTFTVSAALHVPFIGYGNDTDRPLGDHAHAAYRLLLSTIGNGPVRWAMVDSRSTERFARCYESEFTNAPRELPAPIAALIDSSSADLTSYIDYLTNIGTVGRGQQIQLPDDTGLSQ